MPFPFQVGVDIVNIRRLRGSIKRHGQSFLDRIFTQDEQAYCAPKRNKYENYAARFAAKEAVIKAKGGGAGRFRFRDIEVKRGKRGRPYIAIRPSVRREMAIAPDAVFRLSLAHEREFAIATVLMSD